MSRTISSREQTQAQYCAWIALVCFTIFLILCGYFVYLLNHGTQFPDFATGITAELGSGTNRFYLRPWEKTALLSAIFLSVFISAVPAILYRYAYGNWPAVPLWYNRVFKILFALLALYMVLSSAGAV